MKPKRCCQQVEAQIVAHRLGVVEGERRGFEGRPATGRDRHRQPDESEEADND